MVKPKEARDVVNVKEKLEARKQYLELREKSARKFEDCRALIALSGHIEKYDGSEPLELNELFEMKKGQLEDLGKELKSLVKNPAIPDRWIKSGNFDEELIEGELNKVRESLGEPITEKKPEVTIPLRPEEKEMIAKNFPFGLYPRGDKVKYDGDEWIVAGYDGYTGRGILKRQTSPGETEFIFVERIPLYLQNRFTNQELADAQKASTKVAEQNGLSQQACIEMSDDDLFDDERAQAEQDARQPEKMESKFRDWVRGKYEKVKKEVGSLPQDFRDIIDSEREPFKATIKDMNKDLTKVAEKFDRWFDGHRQAVTEALTSVKRANEFRRLSNEIGTDLSKGAQLSEFQDEALLRKLVESDFNTDSLDDESLYKLFLILDNKIAAEVGYSNEHPELSRKEAVDRIVEIGGSKEGMRYLEMELNPVFKRLVAENDELQEKLITSALTDMETEIKHIYPDPEQLTERLEACRAELDSELDKIRLKGLQANRKIIIKIIRQTLNPNLWNEVYKPLEGLLESDSSQVDQLSEKAKQVLGDIGVKKLLALYTEGQTIYDDRITAGNINLRLSEFLEKYPDRDAFEANGGPQRKFRYTIIENIEKFEDVIYGSK